MRQAPDTLRALSNGTIMLTPRLYADSTVFVLTGYRALKLSRIARGGVQSLIDIILRDGVSPSHLPRASRLCYMPI